MTKQKIELELEDLKAKLEFTKTQTEREKLEIAQLRKPWWKREPIATITLILAIVTAFFGFRAPATDHPRGNEQQVIVDDEQRTRRAPSQYWPPNNPTGNRVLDGLMQFRRETEDERWRRMFNEAPDSVQTKIHGILSESENLFGKGEETEVVRLSIQSTLEKAHRVDPLWPRKLRSVSTLMPPRNNP